MSTTTTTEKESVSAMFGNMESQQLSHESDDDVELQVELDPNYQYRVKEAAYKECLGLPIKKVIGDTPADRRKYKAAKKEMGFSEPAVIGDITERTMKVLPQELQDEIIKGYLLKKNIKCSHLYVEEKEMEEVLNDDGSVKLRHRNVPDIDFYFNAAVAVCPEQDQKEFKKALKSLATTFQQKSTRGVDPIRPIAFTDGISQFYVEDGVPPPPLALRLQQIENENADRMRALKYTSQYINSIIKVQQDTHKLKVFPKLCASYNDGKEEKELANKYEELVMEEEDLIEIEKKIAKASGAREAREKNNRIDKMKEIQKLKSVIEAKVYNIVLKKQISVDELKASIATIMKEKEGREDFEIDDYYFPSAEVIESRLPVNRLTPNQLSPRSITPSKVSGKRSRENDDNPRTAKRFPLNSPPNKKHRLSEYYKDVSDDLMFKVGKDGFEQSDGDWNNSKFAERLQALHDEVTA